MTQGQLRSVKMVIFQTILTDLDPGSVGSVKEKYRKIRDKLEIHCNKFDKIKIKIKIK
jgi:hypothetical protein